MASCLILEHDFEVPMDMRTLDDFRRWALSDAFPASGRIDFIKGTIEIDISPENAYTHGTAKTAIVARIWSVVSEQDLGDVFSDRMRLSSPIADLSCEPDVLFVSHASIASGGVRLMEAKGGGKENFVEFEGAADLVVEIVSKSSVSKDTKRLPKAYFKAGVREFWLVDARGDELLFIIYSRGKGRFIAQPRDDEGFQRSDALKRRFRLDRYRDRPAHWRYDLRVEA